MPMCTPTDVRHRAMKSLRRLFARTGYIRHRSTDQLETHGTTRYRKGSEVRFVLRTDAELHRVRRWLTLIGLTPAKPYTLPGRVVQPVYGESAVRVFARNP